MFRLKKRKLLQVNTNVKFEIEKFKLHKFQ